MGHYEAAVPRLLSAPPLHRVKEKQSPLCSFPSYRNVLRCQVKMLNGFECASAAPLVIDLLNETNLNPNLFPPQQRFKLAPFNSSLMQVRSSTSFSLCYCHQSLCRRPSSACEHSSSLACSSNTRARCPCSTARPVASTGPPRTH